MAHELATKADGTAMMAYAGETPWHKLGKRMSSNMTGAEALAAAGLGWEVGKADVFDADMKKIPGFAAIKRMDTGKTFNILSDDYAPVQNSELAGFAEAVVGAGAHFHTAGGLKQGQDVWFCLEIPEVYKIAGFDEVRPYFLCTNNHSGWRALRAFLTPVRVVCANTLRAAIDGSGKNGIYIQHSGDVKERMEQAALALGKARQMGQRFCEVMEVLAQRFMTETEIRDFCEKLFPAPVEEEIKDAVKEKRAELAAMIGGGGIGLNDSRIRGTRYSAFNAVSEFHDHQRNYRSDDGRASAIMFETSMKDKALGLLTADLPKRKAVAVVTG